ncbi:acyl carrier protein [bacterium CPR1]|jgi:acyl carrier protein|nr:acyl carrier protein [bacterium CPR1]
MTREAIQAVINKHIMEISEEIQEAQIDPSRSMKDLGLNSLDIVEIVSCSMRELKVKIPRSELSKLTNLDALVDILHQTVAQKEQAPAS